MSPESQLNKILPTLQIEVDIFSGRPNPKWILTEQQTKEFLEFPQWHEMMVTEENAKNFEIGFNGFIVTKLSSTGNDLPHRFYLVNTYRPHYHQDNVLTKLPQDEMVSREEWMLKTCPNPQEYGDLWSHLLDFIKKKIVPREHKETKIPEKQTETLVEPCPVISTVYDPNSWNNYPNIVAHNNCYNYATDYISNTFAQPGRKSGVPMTPYTCPIIQHAAISDGMVEIAHCDDTKHYYKIALVMAPNQDYHWYRLQTNGNPMWGHKRGGTPVTDLDAAGNLVLDPQTCDRDYGPNGGINYSDFCGYYYWPVGTSVS